VKNTLNISAYLFVQLNDAASLCERIKVQAAQHALRGTVLLAAEGINLFLAGLPEAVRSFVQWLRQDSRLAELVPKESWSSVTPFRKLQVKVKPEIIRMNHPTIRPQVERAPSVDAATLARWLDAGVDDSGQPVVMLDTRNAFEVEHGRFKGALHWNLQKFSDFPEAARIHRQQLQGKTVVSYCTGGIRCEKAALYMTEELGVAHVLQLEGGILKYFELQGSKHFTGHCFVFDERRAVDAQLQPAPQWPPHTAVA
jgi:UPF0176 protein